MLHGVKKKVEKIEFDSLKKNTSNYGAIFFA